MIDIRVLAADQASEQELADYHQVVAASAADWSDEPPEDYGAAVEQLRNPSTVFGPTTFWAAHLDGRLVGFARVSFPGESDHLVVVRCVVHPGFRCRGVGADLLRFLLPEFRARGRSSIEGWNIPQGGVGDRWALGLGFRQVNARVMQRLALREADPVLWAVPAPAGYRAVSWVGSAPDELVTSFAQAQNAIHDAPDGDAEFQFPQWTVEQVRADEQELREQGFERRVVAMVHEADGEVAGFSEVDLRSAQGDMAIINNTAVLAEHRGHGLGRYLKAHSARWLRSELPALRVVLTGTSADNAHMIRVNHEVGYTSTQTALVYNAEVSALAARLSS